MGIYLFGGNSSTKNSSTSSCRCNYCVSETNLSLSTPKEINPNPDPKIWELVCSEQVEKYLVVKIRYPNCKNYEGIKVLIFETTLLKLLSQGEIDPHFGDDEKLIYPIARFAPTSDGFEDAVKTVKSVYLKKKKKKL